WNTISYTPRGVGNTAYLRVIASRTIYDGTNSRTWNYKGWPGNATVTDPLLNDTVYTSFTGALEGGVVGQIQSYSGPAATGTLLKTVTKSYTFLPDPFPADLLGFTTDNLPPYLLTGTTTQWPNGQQSQVKTTYDCGFFTFTDINPGGSTYTSTCPAPATNPTYGLVTAESHSDYGSGAPGPVISTTKTTYLALSNSSYLTANILDLPSSVITTDGSPTPNICAETDYGYDESVADPSGVTEQHVAAPNSVRGNLTSVTRQLFTNPCSSPTPSKTPLKTTKHVYDTGMVHTSTDPLSNPKTYLYSGTYYGAFPTTVTNALNQSMTYTYDFNTGLMASMTDPNSQTTSFPSYDSMLRPTQANYPDGGQTAIAYNYSGNVFLGFTFTKKITSSLNLVSTQIFDGLGRPKQTKATVPTSTCSSGFSYLDTTYDSNGRTFSVSNPYCTTGDATYGITKTYFDPLSRPCLVAPPDGVAPSSYSCPTTSPGNDILTFYSGGCTTVTDQASKSRKSCADGLGRMTGVWEDPSGLNYQTSYTYDALDDLLSVSQSGSRQRTFAHESPSGLST